MSEFAIFRVKKISTLEDVKSATDYLFCTRKGSKYTGDGFRSIFHRYMSRALETGLLVERFQEKDLRAKAASDFEDLKRASTLLDRANAKVTKKHYLRKIQLVESLF